MAACLHLGALAGLMESRRATRVPEPVPEATVEIVSLPAASAPPEAAMPVKEPPPPVVPSSIEAAELPLAPSAVETATPTLATPLALARAVPPLPPRPHPVRARLVRPTPERAESAEPESVTAPPGPLRIVASQAAAQAPARTASEEASFEARVREAVQDAVRYPAAARMMGVTGRARLELEYRAGQLAGVSLVQSAGAPMLDQSAVAAARAAHYPPPPAGLGDHMLRFLIYVNFTAG